MIIRDDDVLFDALKSGNSHADQEETKKLFKVKDKKQNVEFLQHSSTTLLGIKTMTRNAV